MVTTVVLSSLTQFISLIMMYRVHKQYNNKEFCMAAVGISMVITSTMMMIMSPIHFRVVEQFAPVIFLFSLLILVHCIHRIYGLLACDPHSGRLYISSSVIISTISEVVSHFLMVGALYC
jgi:hypothetical protein